MNDFWGLIIKGSGGLYDILKDNNTVVSCRARGAFRHEAQSPTVGDRVLVCYDSLENPIIDKIGERKNLLIRPALANLDTLFIIVPSKRPLPDLFTVDKLSAIAVHNNIKVVIVISKQMLDTESAESTRKIYEKTPFPVFVTDSLENKGCDSLKKYIQEECQGKICAFSGASGVGKSTLLNRLFENLSLSTSDVSEKTGRGRHTTRLVELFKTDEGTYIADTPGFTMLDFERFDFFSLDDLIPAFPEFEECIGGCRYTKCTHTKEEGCAILEKIKCGEISKSRHESYIALRDVLKEKQPWKKK